MLDFGENEDKVKKHKVTHRSEEDVAKIREAKEQRKQQKLLEKAEKKKKKDGQAVKSKQEEKLSVTFDELPRKL